ncbi:WD repeat-containing protein 63 [Allomyces arbusculus]|nr:WD repeat-containing protein 63 [Allomyces arbusculus]
MSSGKIGSSRSRSSLRGSSVAQSRRSLTTSQNLAASTGTAGRHTPASRAGASAAPDPAGATGAPDPTDPPATSADADETAAPSIVFTVPDPLPDGAVPLFLSTATVDLFHLKEKCTEAAPYTFMKRADMLADLFNRAAVSDFHPIKLQLNELQMEEMLLVQDLEWKFGQNYIICFSEEAKNAFLVVRRPATSADAADAEQLGAAAKPPRPATWTCLGSDKEINEEKVTMSRDPIYYRFARKRRKFGQDTHFQDGDSSTGWIDIKPNANGAHTLVRMLHSSGVQAISPMTARGVQTNWNRPVNSSVQYEPLELDAAARATILASEALHATLDTAVSRIERILVQNNAVNIFRNDFVAMGEDEHTLDQGSNSSLQEYQSFTDLKYSKDKSISCVAWHPTQKGVLAVSCTQRSTFDERVQHGLTTRSRQSLVLIWSFYDPIHPQLILEAADDVASFAFHPTNPHMIVGGCVNGQIVLWDISEFQDKWKNKKRDETEESKNVDIDVIKFVAVSSVEYSHRAAVSDVAWLTSEVNHNGDLVKREPKDDATQLVSVGLDGHVLFWDLRYKKDLKSLDQAWKPIFKVPLLAMDGTFDYGLMRVAVDPNVTRLWCATEEGDVIQADWMVEKQDADKGAASRVDMTSGVHYAPVGDVLRSPIYPDILLSVGGWACYVWQDKSSVPLISSALSAAHYTCGAWSPTRPSVFFIGRSDGFVEIWDILDRSHQASQVQAVSSTAVSAINVQTYYSKGHPTHQFIAIGDDDGTVHVLEVPRNIFRPAKNEKAFMRALLDREIKRVAFAAERRTFRAQERQRVAEAKSGGSADGAAPPPAAADAKGPLEGDALEKAFQDLQAATLEALSGAA